MYSRLDPLMRLYIILHIERSEVNIFKGRWKLNIPSKVAFLIWQLFYDRISSKINLVRRGVQLEDGGITCPLCQEQDEDTSHILFICNFSQKIWKRWYKLFGASMALPRSSTEHFCQSSLGLKGH